MGFINGIPGDWTRQQVQELVEQWGNVVALHIRMSQQCAGNYDGVGFVQYRDPEELQRAIRECNRNRYEGKGKDPKTRKWTKEIRLRIDRSTREFDMINLEEDRRKDWESRGRGGVGGISVTGPRVCTSEDMGIWNAVMHHDENRWWGISPWEIAGRPDPEGNLNSPVLDYPRRGV